MTTDLNKKIIIITGASMGIGKSLALNLIRHNARIVINARNEVRLKTLEIEIQQNGGDVLAVAGDITLESDCRNLIEKTIERFGTIDILINNAGVSMRGSVEKLSPQVISEVFKCNVMAPYMLTQMAMPFIKKNKGNVILISSLAGLRGLPYLSAYCSTKMALKGLAQSLRIEHQSDGIHVGLIYVGLTKIDSGKISLAADGSILELKKRDGYFTCSTQEVAEKITRNIQNRKNTTIIGLTGKLYFFASTYLPFIFPWIAKYSINRLKKLYD